MLDDVLHHHGNYLVRRLRLAPGEATPWHRDPFQRVTVVMSGEALAIEFGDGGKTERIEVTAGEPESLRYASAMMLKDLLSNRRMIKKPRFLMRGDS